MLVIKYILRLRNLLCQTYKFQLMQNITSIYVNIRVYSASETLVPRTTVTVIFRTFVGDLIRL